MKIQLLAIMRRWVYPSYPSITVSGYMVESKITIPIKFENSSYIASYNVSSEVFYVFSMKPWPHSDIRSSCQFLYMHSLSHLILLYMTMFYTKGVLYKIVSSHAYLGTTIAIIFWQSIKLATLLYICCHDQWSINCTNIQTIYSITPSSQNSSLIIM